jgi:hypothetical protein
MAGLYGSKNVLLSNNLFRDSAGGSNHYIGTTSPNAALDWSGINTGCQTAGINAALTTGGDPASMCDAAHLLGGYTRNLVPNVAYDNGSPCHPAGLTCNTTNTFTQDKGYGAYPNDNFNDAFSTLSFRNAAAFDYTLVYNPASPQAYLTAAKFGADNRPLGVDMTQMNFVRPASTQVSDRAAIFTFNVTPSIQNFTGMFTVASDPFCASPVADMDPSQFANPGWTGNDRFPQSGSTRSVIVGLNAALSPNTAYYYCLEYQGYNLNGQFSTQRTLSGTQTIQVQTALTSSTPGASGASNLIVEYGGSYSRATDTIAGGGATAAVSCTVGGGVCSASFTAAAGPPLFYRYKIRNASNAVLITQPVISHLPQ